jgi:predicted nucleic acid-binding protein
VRYLLDTNVLSELRRPRADDAVREWIRAQPVATLAISVITLMELEIGVRRVGRRDPGQGEVLRRWLDLRVLAAFRERILPIDVEVARRASALHVPDPGPERDTLIAATALARGLTVATRNIADFAPTGVPLVDPWLT